MNTYHHGQVINGYRFDAHSNSWTEAVDLTWDTHLRKSLTVIAFVLALLALQGILAVALFLAL